MPITKKKKLNTYAHAYFEAFRFPVNKGESSARSRIRVFTLSASPVSIEKEKKNKIEKN